MYAIDSTLTSGNTSISFADSTTLTSWAITFTLNSTTRTNDGGGVIITTTSSGTGGASGLGVSHVVSSGEHTLVLTNGSYSTSNTLGTSSLSWSSGSSTNQYVLAYNNANSTLYLSNLTTGTYIYYDCSSLTTTVSLVSGNVKQWTNGAVELSTISTIADLSSIESNTTAFVSYITTGTVPEPSSFGLLAGLGALAFVASRRRRRVAPAGICR